MNIIVCVKPVLDPELPPAKFRIDPASNRVIPPESMPPVISAYDANAVEAGLRLKDSHGGKLTALTVGPGAATEAVRHALAMGADEGIIIADKALEGMDGSGAAYVLAQAVKKLGGYDLILCGRQAADTDAGQVGSLLAVNLGLPLITVIRSVELKNGGLRVERALTDGYEVYQVPLPALLTVGEGVGQPRLPSGWGVISAARKQVPVWTLADIGADAGVVQARASRLKLRRLYIPLTERKCEVVEGKDAAEASRKLARRLREVGAI